MLFLKGLNKHWPKTKTEATCESYNFFGSEILKIVNNFAPRELIIFIYFLMEEIIFKRDLFLKRLKKQPKTKTTFWVKIFFGSEKKSKF